MANHEDRPIRESIHLLLAFKRKKLGNDTNECIRVVINDYELDLALLEERCKRLEGTWRIHHTVNARDTRKARIWLLHILIDNPTSFEGCIDSLWRTALLQRECAYEKNFLLDTDTKNITDNAYLLSLIPFGKLIEKRVTPSGYHYITNAFDTRKVCELNYVTLIRDGYYFIKEVK